MKRLLTLAALASLLIFGCTDNSSFISSPESDNLSKRPLEEIWGPNGLTSEVARKLDLDCYPPGSDSIFVPISLPPGIVSELTNTKLIDGAVGDSINIFYKYWNGSDSVSIDAGVKILPGAFSGTEEITMTLNNELGTVSFYPHMNFNIPAVLRIKYKHLDLEGVNPDSLGFVFQNYNGDLEPVEYQNLVINVVSGFLYIKDALLPHFSRYGFTR